MKNITRRRFIRNSIATLGAASALTGCSATNKAGTPGRSTAIAPPPKLGPNEKIRVALIGSGGMGRGDMFTFLPNDNVEFPVICDVDDGMIAKGVKALTDRQKPRPEVTKDWRTIMDRQDIHACIVATPDHWHALPTIHACQAGKDVYCEKPLATSIGESRAIRDAARKYGRVIQMGTQWHSAPHFAEAVDYVQSGKLGDIRLVRCWASLKWVHSVGRPADAPVPPGVDYDMWLGPAPAHPFNPARFHFSFRWFWDYAGGLMTDWGVHLINIAMWGMNAGMPLAVSSSGGKYIYDDISETPDTQNTLFTYPDFTMVWEHQMTGGRGSEGREHGTAFYGTEGTLIIGSPGWEVIPETRLDRSRKPIPPTVKAEKHKKGTSDGRPEHVRDFLDCMRSRKQPVENANVGHNVSTTALLGNVALRTQQAIRWDAEKEQPKDNNIPKNLITYPYRAPWKLEV